MFLVAVGLVGLLFGVGSSEVRRFENAAAKDIATRLTGEAVFVKVRTKLDPFQAMAGRIKSATISASEFSTDGLPFFTEPYGSKRGRLDELKISLTNFQLTGLKVKRLDARITHCRFDLGLAQRRGQIRLTESGTGTGTVEVDQADLLDYIHFKHPLLKEVSLQFSQDKVFISGQSRFLSFDAFVEIESRLEPVGGNRIELVDANIKVNGQEANPNSRKTILGLINPVLDLDKDLKLFGALYMNKIEIHGKTLRAEGIAKIPDRLLGTWIGQIGLLFH
ncbi:MAG: DUF2993 domain-containing protein [Fimbriimonadaceae bacterium]|nr:DUF2993 domain-containing protein [Fimbriimonadaceae bacterium]